MNKTYERINWENEPSVATALGATNLNKMDYALNEVDNRVITLDTGKANQADELLDIKSVAYNATTGVWTFTHQNGTVDTFDQNVEKIPVTFSMDANGVITMTTADGTTYTCDVGTLIKTYTFVNSGNIQFTVTTDAQGNKSVTASIIDGSVTRAKLDPDYLAQIDLDVASASASALAASGSATTASNKALDSEAYAIGTRNGVPVTSEDPAYENNSKYYAEHGASSLTGLTDTDISSAEDGQVLKYNGTTQKWENDTGGGGVSSLADLTDTTISSPTNKQGLIFNGTSNKWENADIEGLPSNVITYAQFIQMSDAEQLAFTGYVTDYPGIDDAPTASDTVFDNTGTDLVSNNVNDAIVEVNTKVNNKTKRNSVTITKNTSDWTTNNTWVERCGKVVTVHVFLVGTPTQHKNIATGLPPASETIYDWTSNMGIISIDNTGEMEIYSPATTSSTTDMRTITYIAVD